MAGLRNMLGLSTRRRVAVLGAGPAGLLAAHAATEAGFQVTVFSRPGMMGTMAAKSDLYGCQYLHQFIPGLGLPEAGEKVDYRLIGDSEAYRAKVYGPESVVSVSPDEFGPLDVHLAWDLRLAYQELWKTWGARIVPLKLTPLNVMPIVNDVAFRAVFSSVPIPQICLKPNDHKFQTESVWAIGTGPGNQLPFTPEPFTVVCNGERDTGWYRAANVFGHATLEWPGRGQRPPIRGVVKVDKPLSTDCTCWDQSKRWFRLGRYGQWRKGVLVHEAYNMVKAVLA